jgi:hypothetical protein
VLTAVSRLRRDLARDKAYLPTPLRDLEEKTGTWLAGVPPAAQQRRQQLVGLLTAVLEVRYELGLDEGSPLVLEPDAVATFQERARRQAQGYVDAPWMRTPWIDTALLTNLLAAELVPFSDRQRRSIHSPGGVLSLVWTEVRSGYYDRTESVRRLRQLEGQGYFVHSLVHALLRG